MTARDFFAPLHASEILLNLPAGEYRLALSRLAEYMRHCVIDPGLPQDEVESARSALRELERRLDQAEAGVPRPGGPQA